MAYVNVKDWSVDQVIEWIKGLDDEVLPYTKSFLNNAVTGNQLLQFRADDLENIGVKIFGHQEIILEGIEHLKNFHYELERENIQLFALRLSCAATSLYKELQYVPEGCETVQTETMAGVHNIILTVKPLVCWLKRSPFINEGEYADIQSQLLKLSIEMTFTAHRDKFSQTPVTTIRNNCERLVCLADYLIQEVKDPLILQPASLELTTLRKKEQELGLYIFPSYLAVHQIAEVKHGSPAQLCRKIEKGDEIVQVNYQTVVGWHREKVMLLLQDSSPEVLLTLKKRPQHTKVYGPIYMKPYRLPSKKRGSPYSRWNEDLPSPRLLTINDLPQIPLPKPVTKTSLEELGSESSSDNDTDTPESPTNESPPSLFPLKSRPVLQRRNTITGASPTSTKPYPGIEQFLKMYKPEMLHSSSYHIRTDNFEDESGLLRDKSASCSLGLELTQRPTTVIGISQNRLGANRQNSIRGGGRVNGKRVMFEEKTAHDTRELKTSLPPPNEERSVSVNSLNSLSGGGGDNIDFIDEAEDLQDRSNMPAKDEVEDDETSKEKSLKEELKDVRVHNIIKQFDEKMAQRGTGTLTRTKPHCNKPPKSDAQDEFKFKEGEVCAKYELGIPLVETKNTYAIAPPPREPSHDVPPKPPPRAIHADLQKPKYPADSPKPKIADAVKLQSQQKENLLLPTAHHKPEVVTQKPPLNIEHVHHQKPDILVEHPSSDVVLQTPPKKSEVAIKSGIKMGEVDAPKISTPKSLTMSKVSPTNSIVRAMMYSNRGRNGKKKNTLSAKKRKVSVNDVSPGDMEGYLYKRFRTKDGQQAYWDKLWFVLIGNRLYGFSSRESSKAHVLIYLTGFTVSHATEVKSRSNAFKVYHTGTVFYFSAETHETTLAWIEYITAATLHSDAKPDESVLYSETDDSDGEKPKTPTEKTNEGGIKKFGSLKKFGAKKDSGSNSHGGGSTSLDRKWFFNKSTTSKNSVPVPTAQFRSYRKIPASQNESVSTGNFTSHIPNFANRLESSPQNVSVPNLNLDQKSLKNRPINWNHSSNPSLYNVNDFQPFSPRDNAEFLTLSELLNRQNDDANQYRDEAFNMDLIKPDVVYGEVPIRPKPVEKKRSFKSGKNEAESSSFCFGKRSAKKLNEPEQESATYPKSSKQQDLKNNRSLPRTHKLLESYDAYAVAGSKQYSDSCKSLTKLDETHDSEARIRRDSMEKLSRIDVANPKLKSATQYTPLSLPLVEEKNMNPKLAFELNLDERKGGKLMSFFHSKKEKRGSPHMQRAVRKEIVVEEERRLPDQIQSEKEDPPSSSSDRFVPQVDYPGLEYPPVFEPETYSLSDPQTSLTLLRKRGK